MTNENELNELDESVTGEVPVEKPTLDFSRAKRVEVLKASEITGLSSYSDCIKGIEDFDPEARPQGNDEPLDLLVATLIRKATSIRNGDDFLGHFFEPVSLDDAAFPVSNEDFENAKRKARDILWATIDKDRPRYFLEAGWFVHRTSYGDKVIRDFRALVREILNAPTAYKEPEPAAPLASRTDYGVPVSLTRDQIVPRPDLSRPPEPEPGQVYARSTCRICTAGGFALPHDCMMYQQGNS